MELLNFYQQLYDSGRVTLSGSVPKLKINSDFWKFIHEIALDIAQTLSLSEMPPATLPTKAKETLAPLAVSTYAMCRLSLREDPQPKAKLTEKIDALTPVDSWPQLLLAHGLLAGIIPYYPHLDRDSQIVWQSLAAKSPLTQLMQLSQIQTFPASWSWDFLLCLRQNKALHYLLLNQLVSLDQPSLRRDLGQQLALWQQQSQQQDLLLELYWAFDYWEGHYPWTPDFEEINRDLEAGRIFHEQGWYDFFLPLCRIAGHDREVPVAQRRLRHFRGDFLGRIQNLYNKSRNGHIQ